MFLIFESKIPSQTLILKEKNYDILRIIYPSKIINSKLLIYFY